MGNDSGKRLKCEVCGLEVVVTKGGDGQVQCCGQPMKPK